MKQVFKKIIFCIRDFFKCITVGFKSEISAKHGKRNFILQLISIFLLVLTGMLALANTKLSIDNHLTDYISKNIANNDYGIIYKHSTYEKSYILASNEIGRAHV